MNKKKLLVIVPLSLLLVVFGGINYLTWSSAHEYATFSRHHGYDLTPADLGWTYSEVSFSSTDEITLAGWFIPSENVTGSNPSNFNATIIIVHGHDSNMAHLTVLANDTIEQGTSVLHKAGITLHNAGFNLLLFDIRNHGQSDDLGQVSLGKFESDDLLAAVSYLQTQTQFSLDPDRIGVWAESMGGSLAIYATAKDDGSIKALITDSAPADLMGPLDQKMEEDGVPKFTWPFVKFWLQQELNYDIYKIRAVDVAGDISAPWLIIHGTDDDAVHHRNGEKLYEASNKANTQLWITGEYRHVRSFFDPAYSGTIIDFYENNL